TDQHVGDLQSLLPGVGLGDQQLVDVYPDRPGIGRVEGVLGVDEGRDAPVALGLGHDVEGEAGLTGGLRAVDLDDAAAGDTSHSQCQVEGQGSGGDDVHFAVGGIAHLHHGAFAVLALDL